jgi:hypothetical protein
LLKEYYRNKGSFESMLLVVIMSTSRNAFLNILEATTLNLYDVVLNRRNMGVNN